MKILGISAFYHDSAKNNSDSFFVDVNKTFSKESFKRGW